MHANAPPGGSASPIACTPDTKCLTIDFLKTLFAHTTQPVYVCSFTNERIEGAERHVMTRKPIEIEAFKSQWDIAGRGMFFAVGTVKGNKRHKPTIAETIGLHADIDFDKVDGTPDLAKVLRQISRLRYPPSAIVKSGGGVHLYYLFKEAIDTQGVAGDVSNIDRIEAALRQLADIVAGDLAVCEVSRVLRLPGSHNTKRDERMPVEVLELHGDRRYELDDLEEWFAEQSPVMLRKSREAAKPAGEIDLLAEYAEKHGFKAPIDVEKRLADMMFMGGDDSSVHQTQLSVTASLLNRGMLVDDVVPYVLEATRRAAGEYASRWNWRREERKVRRMCETWIEKHPQKEDKKEEYAQRVAVEKYISERKIEFKTIEGGAGRGEGRQVERVSTASQQNGKVVAMPVTVTKQQQHELLGRAVLAGLIGDNERLINTKNGAWFYSAGIWELRTDKQWLNVRIEQACRRLSFKNTTKLINDTRNWIERDPDLWRDGEIPWDQHGKVPTRSGLIDPRTGTLEPCKPEHYATWRVEVDYKPDEPCPWWCMAINDMFGDREPDERAALISTVQELMGTALIDKKPRALSKACVFWGNENRAKSTVLDVVAGLFGGNPIGASLTAVESPHGLMPFVRRAPWILHEAFGGQWHLSASVKSIVTADPVMINVKNGPMLTQVIRSPIFWATNFQPQFKEATRAIVNRMIVIEVTREFDEARPIGAAAEAVKRGFSKPGEFVVATELPGVLNWALAGLRRALGRGSIAATDSIRETAEAIHRDSNLVAGFLPDCVEFDPKARIKVADFCLAFSAWFVEQKGEDRRPPSNDSIRKALKAVGDGRIVTERTKTSRYYCGVALNKLGLRYHQSAYESHIFEGKTALTKAPGSDVNSLIPAAWDERESIIAMRAYHQRVTDATSGVTDQRNERRDLAEIVGEDDDDE